jgi:oligoribonuclease NrnB/cAMP/cGMP phosphodiesterase (DHH superfamily)
MSKEFVFIDADLDGAGCYLAFKWCTGRQIPYKCTRAQDFERDFKEWLSTNDIKTYKTIYIFDIDVSNHIDLIDHPNVAIVDHHASHIENANKYTQAKTILKEYTSATKLVYNTFKNELQPLLDEQKLLILMIDDYDSYKLKLPTSYKLNLIFWNYQGNRLYHFVNRFEEGFDGFTGAENEIIDFYERKLASIKSNLDVHIATDISIQNTNCKIVSVFATSHINEVADHIIKNYKADIGFVINTNSNKVSLRKSSKCEIDLQKLASKLFDVSGGHKEAAGGELCEKFLLFSKIFTPLTIKVGQ